MRIDCIDLIKIRNVPASKGRNKVSIPDHGFSTIIRLVASSSDVQYVGYGEIRAISKLTGERPDKSYEAAYKVGESLIGMSFEDGYDPLRTTHDLVENALRRSYGIAPHTEIPELFHPAVRLGFDAALLDSLARYRGVSVATLIGAETPEAPVLRNVHARDMSQPGAIFNTLMRDDYPTGWLRGNRGMSPALPIATLNAIATATSGRNESLEGVWFNIDGAWSLNEADSFINSISESELLERSSLKIILEQPFPSHASEWYHRLLENASRLSRSSSRRVRVMLDDSAKTIGAIQRSAEFMPHVDLKLVPQTHGSLFAVRKALSRAKELGFVGDIYLGNAGMNTELNSILLASLSHILEKPPLFSANIKINADTTIQTFYPQLIPDPTNNNLLFLPQGTGWGTNICRSGLERRISKCSRILPGHDRGLEEDELKAQLMAVAVEDQTLSALA